MNETALVIAVHGPRIVLETRSGKVLKAMAPRRLRPLYCGDEVRLTTHDEGDAIICERLHRRRLLVRHDDRGRERPLCANLDQIVIVNDPTTRAGGLHRRLLDCYLVTAEINTLSALICINKIDACDVVTRARIDRELAGYRAIGYPCLLVSAASTQGIDGLAAAMAAHRSCLVGESGVGKTSLIDRLVPGHDLRIGELSHKAGLGRHTTSTTILYHLPHGGDIIDSPGVRSFALGRIEPEQLAWGFREFRPLLEQCRFRNCRHEDDLGCAIRTGVADGAIDPRRYESYRQILATMATPRT